jgi:hypothetical protein
MEKVRLTATSPLRQVVVERHGYGEVQVHLKPDTLRRLSVSQLEGELTAVLGAALSQYSKLSRESLWRITGSDIEQRLSEV